MSTTKEKIKRDGELYSRLADFLEKEVGTQLFEYDWLRADVLDTKDGIDPIAII